MVLYNAGMQIESRFHDVTELFAETLPAQALQWYSKHYHISYQQLIDCGVTDYTIPLLLSEAGVPVFSLVRNAINNIVRHSENVQEDRLFDIIDPHFHGDLNPVYPAVEQVVRERLGAGK